MCASEKRLALVGMVSSFVSLLRLLWPKNKIKIIIGLIFSLLLASTSVAIPYLQGRVADVLLLSSVSRNFNSELTLWLAIYAVVLLSPSLLSATRRITNRLLRYNLVEFAEVQWASERARLDISVQENPDNHAQFLRVQEGFWRINSYMIGSFELISTAFGLVLSSVVMFKLSPWGCLLVFVACMPELMFRLLRGTGTYHVYASSGPEKRYIWATRDHFRLLDHLIPLKLFQLEWRFVARLSELFQAFHQKTVRKELKYFFQELGALLFGSGVTAFVIYRLTAAALRRETPFVTDGGQLAIGTWLFALGAIAYFRTSLSAISMSIGDLHEDGVFISRDFFSVRKLESPNKFGTKRLSSTNPPKIEFRDVWFRYSGIEKWILSGLNLSIESGEILILLGMNGAGKSTLFKLLAGLYPPTKGSILVDGNRIEELDRDNWYSLLGVMSQDIPRYHGYTQREATILGRADARLEERRVQMAEAGSGLDRVQHSWAKGAQTMLGAQFGGVEPSGGQWQKIALSMVFYRLGLVNLIDEPTSNMDLDGKLEMRKHLENLRGKSSMVIATHDPLLFRLGERVCVLNGGQIQEEGSPQDLLGTNGEYARIVSEYCESLGITG